MIQTSLQTSLQTSSEAPLYVPRTLPRSLRFKRSIQFQHAKTKGQRVHTSHLIAYLVKNDQEPTRLGITVSKKVGRAHQRTYWKRILREAFRHSDLRQSKGFDVSLIAKNGMTPPKLEALIYQLNQLHQRSSALLERSNSRSQAAHASRKSQ
jgi:ribonuclease P protein component